MIVLLNGPCGIGNAAVAWELTRRFERAVMLDGDYLGAVQPLERNDDARLAYLFQTIHHLVSYHIEYGGYHDFVIPYVFETPESLAELRHLLDELDDEIYAFRLAASDEVMAARIGKYEREADAGLRPHLRHYQELAAAQEQAALRGDMGFVIDTSGLDATQVAEVIWQNLREAVELVPYDPAWAEQFEVERAQIAAALGGLALEIHHIGSTAVPDLEAKPVIDIMVVVGHLDEAGRCIGPLQTLGYSFIDYPQNTTRRFFRKGVPRTHHLHIMAADHPSLAGYLDFRDMLRAQPALRQRYGELKRTLAKAHKTDRAKYSELKGAFIVEALRNR